MWFCLPAYVVLLTWLCGSALLTWFMWFCLPDFVVLWFCLPDCVVLWFCLPHFVVLWYCLPDYVVLDSDSLPLLTALLDLRAQTYQVPRPHIYIQHLQELHIIYQVIGAVLTSWHHAIIKNISSINTPLNCMYLQYISVHNHSLPYFFFIIIAQTPDCLQGNLNSSYFFLVQKIQYNWPNQCLIHACTKLHAYWPFEVVLWHRKHAVVDDGFHFGDGDIAVSPRVGGRDGSRHLLPVLRYLLSQNLLNLSERERDRHSEHCQNCNINIYTDWVILAQINFQTIYINND